MGRIGSDRTGGSVDGHLDELLTDSYQWHEVTTTNAVRSDTALNPAGNGSGGNGGSGGGKGEKKICAKCGLVHHTQAACWEVFAMCGWRHHFHAPLPTRSARLSFTKSLQQVHPIRKTLSCFHTEPLRSFDNYREITPSATSFGRSAKVVSQGECLYMSLAIRSLNG